MIDKKVMNSAIKRTIENSNKSTSNDDIDADPKGPIKKQNFLSVE